MEKIRAYLKDLEMAARINFWLGALFIVCAAVGVWHVSSHGSIFGQSLIALEDRIIKEKTAIESYSISTSSERKLQEVAMKYAEMSLGQMYMFRTAVDFAVLGAFFWNGFFLIGLGVAKKVSLRKLREGLDELGPNITG